MIAALRSVAYFVSGRIALPRPYVCGSRSHVRQSLPAAIYREYAKTGVVRCRCGQPMTVVPHPAYRDLRSRVEISR